MELKSSRRRRSQRSVWFIGLYTYNIEARQYFYMFNMGSCEKATREHTCNICKKGSGRKNYAGTCIAKSCSHIQTTQSPKHDLIISRHNPILCPSSLLNSYI